MKDPCSSVSTLLEKYLDQEATREEKSLVEAHLPGCPTCRDALKSMESLRALLSIPVEESVPKEDFERVWQKIKRETQRGQIPSRWESFRSWFDLSLLSRKKIWAPVAVATLVVIIIFITAPLFLKKSPPYPNASVVEYVESDTNNVMIYESEKGDVAVIWILDEPDREAPT